MPSSQKAFAQLMVTMKTTHKLSLRPESETGYSTRYQTYNRSTLRLWGGKTQDHSLVYLFPLHHSIDHPRHMQKGYGYSPLQLQSYVQPHSVQSFWTRDVSRCIKYKGHQTLIYLLHIRQHYENNVSTRGYVDVTRWNHNRTQAIKVWTHSAIWVCLYFGRHFIGYL